MHVQQRNVHKLSIKSHLTFKKKSNPPKNIRKIFKYLWRNCEQNYKIWFKTNQNKKNNKKKKHDVHRLTPNHISQQMTMNRLLYGKYLGVEKRKHIVRIDEGWTYLSYCNRKISIYCRKSVKKVLACCFR